MADIVRACRFSTGNCIARGVLNLALLSQKIFLWFEDFFNLILADARDGKTLFS
jgi:hypothetical protein